MKKIFKILFKKKTFFDRKSSENSFWCEGRGPAEFGKAVAQCLFGVAFGANIYFNFIRLKWFMSLTGGFP